MQFTKEGSVKWSKVRRIHLVHTCISLRHFRRSRIDVPCRLIRSAYISNIGYMDMNQCTVALRKETAQARATSDEATAKTGE
jgi:hypothetical protein